MCIPVAADGKMDDGAFCCPPDVQVSCTLAQGRREQIYHSYHLCPSACWWQAQRPTVLERPSLGLWADSLGLRVCWCLERNGPTCVAKRVSLSWLREC